MQSPYRKYVTGEKLEAFKAGLAETLGYPERAQAIRVSVRTINRRNVLLGLIGIEGKPAGRVFELPLPDPKDLTPARFTALGAEMGRAVDGWLRPHIQEPLQAEAAARGYSVWNTHEIEELAQDAIDEWEAIWRAHLGGKLHVKAKVALVKTFSEEMMKLLLQKAASRGKKKEGGDGDS